MSHNKDSICSCSSCLLVALGHSFELFSHACSPHVSCCRIAIDLSVFSDSLYGDGMYDTVSKLFHIGASVVCEAGWACYDELMRRRHSLVVSVIDVLHHEVDSLLGYYVRSGEREL